MIWYLLFSALYLLSIILFKCPNSEYEMNALYSVLTNPHNVKTNTKTGYQYWFVLTIAKYNVCYMQKSQSSNCEDIKWQRLMRFSCAVLCKVSRHWVIFFQMVYSCLSLLIYLLSLFCLRLPSLWSLVSSSSFPMYVKLNEYLASGSLILTYYIFTVTGLNVLKAASLSKFLSDI